MECSDLNKHAASVVRTPKRFVSVASVPDKRYSNHGSILSGDRLSVGAGRKASEGYPGHNCLDVFSRCHIVRIGREAEEASRKGDNKKSTLPHSGMVNPLPERLERMDNQKEPTGEPSTAYRLDSHSSTTHSKSCSHSPYSHSKLLVINSCSESRVIKALQSGVKGVKHQAHDQSQSANIKPQYGRPTG